jgi:membrane protein implicated in regulation of membrane protease activity
MIIALAALAALAAIVIIAWAMIDSYMLSTIVGLTILFFTACVAVGLLILAINDARRVSRFRSRSHRKTAEAESQRRTLVALVEGEASGPDHPRT